MVMMISLWSAACAEAPAAPSRAAAESAVVTPATLGAVIGVSSVGNPNGIDGAMPAYYDGRLFTINFKELPSGGEGANLGHNGSINTIYQSDKCTPGGTMFVSVLDAIQGDGFNPLWREVQVVFKNPASCQQLTSDTAILAAASSGLVTLSPTTELYRCSVVGKP
jgi:hypothetical protein